jgi:hypothetical protein
MSRVKRWANMHPRMREHERQRNRESPDQRDPVKAIGHGGVPEWTKCSIRKARQTGEVIDTRGRSLKTGWFLARRKYQARRGHHPQPKHPLDQRREINHAGFVK